MTQRTKNLKIFFASSGELQAERKESYAIVTKLNKRFLHLYFEPLLFEDDTSSGNNPGFENIQDRINLLLDEADIVVVILYSKIGEFTKEEFNRALDQNKKVFLYLKSGLQPTESEKIRKYLELTELREKIERESQIRHVSFTDTDNYHSLIYQDLERYIGQTYPEVQADEPMLYPPEINENKLKDYPVIKPYFTGRDTEIKAFGEAIENGNSFIAIDGPGGIGKTQFVSRCIEKFIPSEKVMWFSCNAASHLDTLITQAGYPELLKGSSKTDREKFSAFKDKLQENGFYLFLDNFQDTNGTPVFKEFLAFIQEYLKKGCVIVIDRDDIRSAALTPKSIKIEGFKENKLEYALALISYGFNEVEISDAELEKLCEQLKGYPFAINLAIVLLNSGVTPAEIIKNIVEDDSDQNSERLLNAIFSRPDATQEERDFIRQFSVFTGSVTMDAIQAIMPAELAQAAPQKLRRKNLLTVVNGNYEIHPLVREFCYKDLEDKETIHAKAAEYYITRRNSVLSPALEEQVFYHLAKSKQWERIEKEIEEKGRQYILIGQLGLVIELLDKLKTIDIEKPIFDILYGDIAEIQGDWKKALAYYVSAKNNKLDQRIAVEGLIKYGEMIDRIDGSSKALSFYEEADVLAQKNNYVKEQARALNNIGLVYTSFGELDKADEKYNQGLRLRITIDDKEGIATSILNIASNQEQRGDLSGALASYNESLKISEQIINKSGIADALNAIAYHFVLKGKLDEALVKYNQSFVISQQIGNKSSIAWSLNNIGIVLSAKGRQEDALLKYQESLELSEIIGNQVGIAASKMRIGVIYTKQNKLPEALELCEESLKILIAVGEKHSIGAALNNLSNVLQLQGKMDEAMTKLQESLKIQEEIGNIIEVTTVFYNIGSIYETQRRFDKALFYLFKCYASENRLGIKFENLSTIESVIKIRDKKLGLEKFKPLAKKVFNSLPPETQKYLPINEWIKEPIHHSAIKLGRNDPCHCGSGKKYKNCHGVN